MKRKVAQFSGKVEHFRRLIGFWKRMDGERRAGHGGSERGPAPRN